MEFNEWPLTRNFLILIFKKIPFILTVPSVLKVQWSDYMILQCFTVKMLGKNKKQKQCTLVSLKDPGKRRQLIECWPQFFESSSSLFLLLSLLLLGLLFLADLCLKSIGLIDGLDLFNRKTHLGCEQRSKMLWWVPKSKKHLYKLRQPNSIAYTLLTLLHHPV